MSTHITGWLTILGLVATSLLFVLNHLDPQQGTRRIMIHCAVGKFTLITVGAHIWGRYTTGFTEVAIWLAVGLILITIATGLTLKYLPNTGKIRFLARSVHPVLMVGIVMAVAHHIYFHLELL